MHAGRDVSGRGVERGRSCGGGSAPPRGMRFESSQLDEGCSVRPRRDAA